MQLIDLSRDTDRTNRMDGIVHCIPFRIAAYQTPSHYSQSQQFQQEPPLSQQSRRRYRADDFMRPDDEVVEELGLRSANFQDRAPPLQRLRFHPAGSSATPAQRADRHLLSR